MPEQQITLRANIDPHCYDVECSERNGRPHIEITILEGTTTILHKPTLALAKIVAKVSIDTNETCAITMEPLKTYDSVQVGVCGHVFSNVVTQVEKCPLCRTFTGWAEVTLNY